MDSVVSNHMTGTTSLFTSYATNRNTLQKVSISDGKYLLLVGFGNGKVPNGTLEDVFHVQGIPTNFLFIYFARQKVIRLNFGQINVLKDIKHSLKLVSMGLVNHDAGVYKFTGFNSCKIQLFNSYVVPVDEKKQIIALKIRSVEL